MALALPPGGGGLPPIGAQAVLLGMAQFNQSTTQVVNSLNTINQSTLRLSETSRTTYDNSTQNYNHYVQSVQRGSGQITVAQLAMAEVIGNVFTSLLDSAVRAGEAFLTAGANLEKSLQGTAVITGASTKQMQDLGDQVLDLTRNFNQSATAVATQQAELAKAGLSYDDIANGALKAASALQTMSLGDLNASEAADVLAKALKAYNLTGADSVRVATAVGGAAQTSAGGFKDFEQAFKPLISLAAALKIPIEDLSAAVAVLTNAGMSGTNVGSNLRQMFLRLIEPTSAAVQTMQKYNISLYDTKGAFVGLPTLFQELNNAFGESVVQSGKLTEEQRDQAIATLGMSRSLTGFLGVVSQTPQAFQNARDSIDKFRATDALERFNADLKDQLGIATNQLLAFGAVFTGPLVKAIEGGVTDVNDQLRQITLEQVRQDGEKFLSTMETVFGALSDDIKPLETGVAGVETGIASIMGIFGGSQGVLTSTGNALNDVAKAIALIAEVSGTLAAATGGAIEMLASEAGATSEIYQGTAVDIDGAAKNIVDNIGNVVALTITYGKTAYDVFTTVAADFGITRSGFDEDSSAIIAATNDLIGSKSHWADNEIEADKKSAEAIAQFIKDAGAALSWFITKIGDVDLAWSKFNLIQDKALSHIPGAVGEAYAAAAATEQDAIDHHEENWKKWAEFVPNVIDEAYAKIEKAQADVHTILDKTPQDFQVISDNVKKYLDGILAEMQKNIPGIDAWVSKIREAVDAASGAGSAAGLLDQRHGEQGGGGGSVSTTPNGPVVVPDLDKADTAADRFLQHVRQLLADIPGITDEVTKWVAEITKLDADKLAAINVTLHAQAGVMMEILQSRASLLAIEIQIAQVDETIAALQRQQQRLQLQEAQALQPLKEQAIALDMQSIAIQQKMLPIQNQIADIDKKIALAQREDLGLKLQSLQIQQRMLPIQNAIADIDKKIADTQRENYSAEIAMAQIQLQELPIQNQIADLQKRMSDNLRVNYAQERAKLILQQQELPIQQHISDIDEQINALQRVNYDLEGQILQTQADILPIKQQEALIDAQLAALNQTNYALELDKARTTQQELPIKQKIADLEQKINDIVNQRAALLAKRDQLLAEKSVADINKQMDAVDKQLTDLWAKFGSGRGPDSASLVPQIIGLEQQKATLQASLKPAQDMVDTLKQQQDEQDRNNELTKIGLQLQEQDLKDVLDPMEQHIKDLDAQAAAQQAANDVIKLGLEQQKAALDAVLVPLERHLQDLQNEKDIAAALRDIQINSLEKQKQLYTDMLLPLEKQIKAIDDAAAATKISGEISNTYLQEQIQGLQDVLDKLEKQRIAIEREQQAESLRNEIVRLGLEQQKQRLDDVLRGWQDQLDIINRTKTAEDLRNAILIANLEIQKQHLQDLLKPYQDDKDAVDRQTAALQLQEQAIKDNYDAQVLKLQALIDKNNLYKLDLEDAKLKEQARLSDLIQKFQDAIDKSGAFSASEATELTKRLGYWDGEKSKLDELKNKYQEVVDKITTAGGMTTSLATLSAVLNSETTSVNTLTTSYNNLRDAMNGVTTATLAYEKTTATEATANAVAQATFAYYRGIGYSFDMASTAAYNYVKDILNRKVIGFADGGVVPGPIGAPMPAIVHGGEYVVSNAQQREPMGAWARSVTTYNQQHTEINYNFSANYQRQQDPITASMDMRSIIELTR